MWHGKYHFFDYKYNIAGYSGQDYMSPVQYIMVGIGIAVMIVLLILLRKTKKQTSKRMLWIMGAVFTSLYIIKTTWESVWDVKTFGEFNIGVLPFDTCSIFMPALLMAGLAKEDSKLEVVASTFLATVGFAGGVANFIFLRGLNYYPMFSFGALYSYFWHLAMVFVALYIPITKFRKFIWWDIFNGNMMVLAAAVVVIPFDYITTQNFMLLYSAGGIPGVEKLAEKIIAANLRPFVTLIVLILYVAVAALMVSIYIGIPALINKIKNRKPKEEPVEVQEEKTEA